MRTLSVLLVSLLFAAACSEDPAPRTPPAAAATPATPAPADDPIEAALTHPGRLADDLQRDVQRKPKAVLTFFGIRSGMTVLDLYSGGGYYAELLSYVVGPGGRVYAHNNTPYLAYVADELERRYQPGRLGNVERLLAENNELDLPAQRFDAVLMVLSYHDIYYVDPDGNWATLDGPKLLAELHAAMKPGAVLGIVDHHAAPGSPPQTGTTLHRIDPEIVKREVAAAGFVLEGESDALRNPADDLTRLVFDEAIRGRTSRFILRFRKPAA